MPHLVVSNRFFFVAPLVHLTPSKMAWFLSVFSVITELPFPDWTRPAFPNLSPSPAAPEIPVDAAALPVTGPAWKRCWPCSRCFPSASRIGPAGQIHHPPAHSAPSRRGQLPLAWCAGRGGKRRFGSLVWLWLCACLSGPVCYRL